MCLNPCIKYYGRIGRPEGNGRLRPVPLPPIATMSSSGETIPFSAAIRLISMHTLTPRENMRSVSDTAFNDPPCRVKKVISYIAWPGGHCRKIVFNHTLSIACPD